MSDWPRGYWGVKPKSFSEGGKPRSPVEICAVMGEAKPVLLECGKPHTLDGQVVKMPALNWQLSDNQEDAVEIASYSLLGREWLWGSKETLPQNVEKYLSEKVQFNTELDDHFVSHEVRLDVLRTALEALSPLVILELRALFIFCAKTETEIPWDLARYIASFPPVKTFSKDSLKKEAIYDAVDLVAKWTTLHRTQTDMSNSDNFCACTAVSKAVTRIGGKATPERVKKQYEDFVRLRDKNKK